MAKCPCCNGTGRTKMVTVVKTNNGIPCDFPCIECNGTGEVELTNEEWFCGLSTEEKAKWMFRLTYKCYWCGREYEKTKKYNEKECPFQKCLDDSKGFEKWLKQPHTTKE